MNLTSKSLIKNLLCRQEIRPSKRLGQNFLVDKGTVRKIIEAAELQPDDTVLEIGPGLGVLTQELAKRVKKVIAVEKDQKLYIILKELLECSNVRNVRIVRDDILKLKIENLKIENYKVIGNLPFYLTAPVIRQFLEITEARPLQMTLVVQKEVGQRICSKPPDMNLLAVSVQFYSEPKIISYISKKSFWPSPEVDAAILKIVPHKAVPHQYLRYDAGLREQFFKIVRSGFSQPRKQLINNLSRGLNIDKKKIGEWLLKNNIQPTQRAETLSVKDWVKLTKCLVSNNIETRP